MINSQFSVLCIFYPTHHFFLSILINYLYGLPVKKNLLFILFLALIKYIKKRHHLYIYLNKVITKEKNLYLLIVIIINLLF